MKDKDVIESWLKLYGLITGNAYSVVEWPDQQDRTEKAIDALCEDVAGNRLAIEHTLIQPFKDEKADSKRFVQALASLENDPDLVLDGFAISVTQAVGSVPRGVKGSDLSAIFRSRLREILPRLPIGRSPIQVPTDSRSIPLTVCKEHLRQGEKPSFTTARIWPGDPGPELIMKALDEKVPKLAKHSNATRILLWEKDAIAGTPESQFERLPKTDEVKQLLGQIDAIWTVNTCALETESVIFTNDVWPTLRNTQCSLNLKTGDFWRKSAH